MFGARDQPPSAPATCRPTKIAKTMTHHRYAWSSSEAGRARRIGAAETALSRQAPPSWPRRGVGYPAVECLALARARHSAHAADPPPGPTSIRTRGGRHRARPACTQMGSWSPTRRARQVRSRAGSLMATRLSRTCQTTCRNTGAGAAGSPHHACCGVRARAGCTAREHRKAPGLTVIDLPEGVGWLSIGYPGRGRPRSP